MNKITLGIYHPFRLHIDTVYSMSLSNLTKKELADNFDYYHAAFKTYLHEEYHFYQLIGTQFGEWYLRSMFDACMFSFIYFNNHSIINYTEACQAKEEVLKSFLIKYTLDIHKNIIGIVDNCCIGGLDQQTLTINGQPAILGATILMECAAWIIENISFGNTSYNSIDTSDLKMSYDSLEKDLFKIPLYLVQEASKYNYEDSVRLTLIVIDIALNSPFFDIFNMHCNDQKKSAVFNGQTVFFDPSNILWGLYEQNWKSIHPGFRFTKSLEILSEDTKLQKLFKNGQLASFQFDLSSRINEGLGSKFYDSFAQHYKQFPSLCFFDPIHEIAKGCRMEHPLSFAFPFKYRDILKNKFNSWAVISNDRLEVNCHMIDGSLRFGEHFVSHDNFFEFLNIFYYGYLLEGNFVCSHCNKNTQADKLHYCFFNEIITELLNSNSMTYFDYYKNNMASPLRIDPNNR